jgi:hypothetical protein
MTQPEPQSPPAVWPSGPAMLVERLTALRVGVGRELSMVGGAISRAIGRSSSGGGSSRVKVGAG